MGHSKGDPGRKWETYTCTFWDAVKGTPGEFAPCRPLLCDRKYRYMCPVFARYSPHCFPKNIVACVPCSPVSPLLCPRNIGTGKGDPVRTRDTYPYIFWDTVGVTPADHGTDSAVFSVAQRGGGTPGTTGHTPMFFSDTVRGTPCGNKSHATILETGDTATEPVLLMN